MSPEHRSQTRPNTLRESAVTSAARCGHASGMVVLMTYCKKPSDAWEAEAAAWEQRYNTALDHLPYAADCAAAKQEAKAAHNQAFSAVTESVIATAANH